MALANLNRFRSNQLSKSPAHSVPLGIYKLDSMIRSELPDDISAKINLNNLPSTEKFHRTVYNENRMNFDRRDIITLDDGTEIPMSVVNKCLDEFTHAIIFAVNGFFQRYKLGNVQAAILTGGGSLPSRISDRIIKGIEHLNFPVLRAHKNIARSRTHVDPIDQELVRGASAIGGNSVLFVLENEIAREEKISTNEVAKNLFGSL
jgi:hypothetical protein